jgi:hypothetical protein
MTLPSLRRLREGVSVTLLWGGGEEGGKERERKGGIGKIVEGGLI